MLKKLTCRNRHNLPFIHIHSHSQVCANSHHLFINRDTNKQARRQLTSFGGCLQSQSWTVSLKASKSPAAAQTAADHRSPRWIPHVLLHLHLFTQLLPSNVDLGRNYDTDEKTHACPQKVKLIYHILHINNTVQGSRPYTTCGFIEFYKNATQQHQAQVGGRLHRTGCKRNMTPVPEVLLRLDILT